MKKEILDQIEKYQHIIWDWNGTILDDIDISIQTINEILPLYDLPTVSKDRYHLLFRFPLIEYYKDLGFNFNKGAEGTLKESFAVVGDQFIEKYKSRVLQSKLFDGMIDIFSNIKDIKKSLTPKKQSILSAASEKHLLQLIKHFDVYDYFDHIHGIDNHYATSKLQRGFDLLKVSGIAAKDSLLIGDTEHDYDVAKDLGVNFLLLGDGHQNLGPLKLKLGSESESKNIFDSRY
ncbi:MAG: HAD family hydrolase [Oligoflexia bacterium]|nr:HAD family hydrolase [Oligoflexia bacterium]